MKKLLKSVVAIALAACVCTAAQAKTYKLAFNGPEDGAPGLLVQEFTKAVAERTDDRVKVKVFWNGTLGSQGQYLQQIKSGVIDMGLVSSAELENIVPELAAVNLPYVFPNTDVYAEVFADENIKNIMKESMKNKGLVFGAYLNNAARDIYSSKELKSIDDLKGLKIRTSPAETYIKMFTAFGAVPTPLDFSEIFSSLQQGLIDGAEGGLAALYELNFSQVAKYGLKTGHSRLTDFIICSSRVEGKMGAEDFKIVQEEFEKISQKSMKFVDDHMAVSIQKAIDENGAIIHDCDVTPFMEAVKPIYKEAAADPVKKPLLEAIFKKQGRTLE